MFNVLARLKIISETFRVVNDETGNFKKGVFKTRKEADDYVKKLEEENEGKFHSISISEISKKLNQFKRKNQKIITKKKNLELQINMLKNQISELNEKIKNSDHMNSITEFQKDKKNLQENKEALKTELKNFLEKHKKEFDELKKLEIQQDILRDLKNGKFSQTSSRKSKN